MKAVFKSNEVDYHPEFRPITQIRKQVQEPLRHPVCDICDLYEAAVHVNDAYHCEGCADEIGVKLL